MRSTHTSPSASEQNAKKKIASSIYPGGHEGGVDECTIPLGFDTSDIALPKWWDEDESVLTDIDVDVDGR